ncbi:hypothetical protein HAX54_016326, partial [Datura stramonium]|nr:hypothetical protein [Datura stramonium]
IVLKAPSHLLRGSSRVQSENRGYFTIKIVPNHGASRACHGEQLVRDVSSILALLQVALKLGNVGDMYEIGVLNKFIKNSRGVGSLR